MNNSERVSVDLRNVQGLVGQGYLNSRVQPSLPVSRFLLFRFGPASNPRAFLRRLTPLVTSVAAWRVPAAQQPRFPLNVGLSFQGIQVLAMLDPETVQEEFPTEFRAEPDHTVLGDYGPSDNYWNGTNYTDLACLVTVWGPDCASLNAFAEQIEGWANTERIDPVYPEGPGKQIAGNFLADGQVHFGFRDGLTGPNIVWDDNDSNQANRTNFRHFLVGYSTEDIPSSPSPAAGMPAKRAAVIDFVRDGSYLALRVMRQDVAGFFDYLEQQLDRLPSEAGDTKDQRREWLKSKMLGRWPNGNPVLLRPNRPGDPLTPEEADQFTYADDPGLKCPTSAHVRVVNPRGRKLFSRAEPVPVLLRRGTPYGKAWSGTEDGVERGLIGLFLCASLNRQFEKLLGWINHNDFGFDFEDLRGQDSILGNADYPGASRSIRLPHEHGTLSLPARPTFVHTKGTAYFFLPSMSTLRSF
jgi:hypothetical protein